MSMALPHEIISNERVISLIKQIQDLEKENKELRDVISPKFVKCESCGIYKKISFIQYNNNVCNDCIIDYDKCYCCGHIHALAGLDPMCLKCKKN